MPWQGLLIDICQDINLEIANLGKLTYCEFIGINVRLQSSLIIPAPYAGRVFCRNHSRPPPLDADVFIFSRVRDPGSTLVST